MRLFLDANILFTAAHNPNGKSALIIDLGSQGYWKVLSSNYAVEEAQRNIAKKFHDRLPMLDAVLAKIEIVGMNPELPCPLPLPAKDMPILVAAIHCKATHLLTGDIRDFGSYMNRKHLPDGLIIQTVADFLKDLRSRGQPA